MHTTSTRRRPAGRTALLVGGSAVALLALAGCSAAAASGGTTRAPAQAAQNGGDQQGRGGVSGLIAYAQDDLLQVQGESEQTAVRYTADTTVTKTVTVDASTIAVGDCIVAVTSQDADTATTIRVTAAADDGTCTAGFSGGMRDGGGMPSDAPSGAPDGSGIPSGAPDGGAPTGAPDGHSGGFGSFTTGVVTAVSGSTLTVETTDQDGGTSTAEVAVGSGTTVTTTTGATAADLAVGLCVTAQGTADDSGGYDAMSLTLSDPDTEGNCSTGFRGMGGRPGGQGGPAGGSDG